MTIIEYKMTDQDATARKYVSMRRMKRIIAFGALESVHPSPVSLKTSHSLSVSQSAFWNMPRSCTT